MKLARRLLLAVALLPALALAAPTDMSRDELKARQAKGQPTVLIDVRSPAEFAAGHIPGAINIPVDQVEARIGEIDKLRGKGEIVLYCRSGRRAGVAAGVLESRGYRGLRHLDGDFPAWQAAGLPVAPCTNC